MRGKDEVSSFQARRGFAAEGFEARSREAIFSLNAKKSTVARSGRGKTPHRGVFYTRPFESLVLFSPNVKEHPMGALLRSEREGFEPSKPFCDLRDFQSRALDQLGDLSAVPESGEIKKEYLILS